MPDLSEFMGKKVAFCARVSKNRDEQALSFENQFAMFRERVVVPYGLKEGQYVTFQDEVSGFKTEKRRNFLAMMEMCKGGEISLIVVWSSDRWMRRASHALLHLEFLFEKGIPIYDMSKGGFLEYGTANQRLATQILDASVPEFFRNDIRDKTLDALKRKVSDRGEWIGKVPYGYRDKNANRYMVVRGKRKKVPCELLVVPERAQIVRRVAQGSDMSERAFAASMGITRGVLQAIRGCIGRKVYHGFVPFRDQLGKRYLFKGKHQPILDD